MERSDNLTPAGEIERCKRDFCYFVERYLRLQTEDGPRPVVLNSHQKAYLKWVKEHPRVSYWSPFHNNRGRVERWDAWLQWFAVTKIIGKSNG